MDPNNHGSSHSRRHHYHHHSSGSHHHGHHHRRKDYEHRRRDSYSERSNYSERDRYEDRDDSYSDRERYENRDNYSQRGYKPPSPPPPDIVPSTDVIHQSAPPPVRPKNYKLLMDPFIIKGCTKLYRYEGIVPNDPTHPPVVVKDPRSSVSRIWTKLEPLDLPVPQFKIDSNYVGVPPAVEVTISNLNDNIDKGFLYDMVHKFGAIEDLKIFYHPVNNKHLGLARIVFKSVKSAENCVDKLGNTSVMGKVLRVFPDAFGEECNKMFEEMTTSLKKPDLDISGASEASTTDNIPDTNSTSSSSATVSSSVSKSQTSVKSHPSAPPTPSHPPPLIPPPPVSEDSFYHSQYSSNSSGHHIAPPPLSVPNTPMYQYHHPFGSQPPPMAPPWWGDHGPTSSSQSPRGRKWKEKEKEEGEDSEEEGLIDEKVERKPLDLDTRIEMLLRGNKINVGGIPISSEESDDDSKRDGHHHHHRSRKSSSLSSKTDVHNPPPPGLEEEFILNGETDGPLSTPPSPFISEEIYLNCFKKAIEMALEAREREERETTGILGKSGMNDDLHSEISSEEDETLSRSVTQEIRKALNYSENHTDMDDLDDKMSLSSLSSGDEKIQVQLPNSLPSLHHMHPSHGLSVPPQLYPPAGPTPLYPGPFWGPHPVPHHPYSFHHVPVRPLTPLHLHPPPTQHLVQLPRLEDTVESTPRQVKITNILVDRLSQELKQILKRDINKKMVESIAFQTLDTWWERESQKEKEPDTKIDLDTLNQPRDNVDPFTWGGFGLGFKGTLLKMPSFRMKRKILPPSNLSPKSKRSRKSVDEESSSSSEEEGIVKGSDDEVEDSSPFTKQPPSPSKSESFKYSSTSSSSSTTEEESEDEIEAEDSDSIASLSFKIKKSTSPLAATSSTSKPIIYTPSPKTEVSSSDDEDSNKKIKRRKEIEKKIEEKLISSEDEEENDVTDRRKQKRKDKKKSIKRILSEEEQDKEDTKVKEDDKVRKEDKKQEKKEVEVVLEKKVDVLSAPATPRPVEVVTEDEKEDGEIDDGFKTPEGSITPLLSVPPTPGRGTLSSSCDEEDLALAIRSKRLTKKQRIKTPPTPDIKEDTDGASPPILDFAKSPSPVSSDFANHVDHSYCRPKSSDDGSAAATPVHNVMQHDHGYTFANEKSASSPVRTKETVKLLEQPKSKHKTKEKKINELNRKTHHAGVRSYSSRDMKAEAEILFSFLTKGVDAEDISFFKRSYQAMLSDYQMGYWLDDTHWVDHPVTDIPSAAPEKKKKRVEELHVHVTGCARTEGFYKIDLRQKACFKHHFGQTIAQQLEGSRMEKIDASLKAKASSAYSSISREARSNQRRLLTAFGTATDSDLLKFNVLKFRKKQLRFAKSAIHDWGLFAMEAIAADEMVIEYVGQMIRPSVADLRERQYEAIGIGSSYLFRIDLDTIIDATRCGNLARFINHSCNPNCYAKNYYN